MPKAGPSRGKKKRAGKISLHPLTPEQALRHVMPIRSDITEGGRATLDSLEPPKRRRKAKQKP